jgi:molecular chaperone HscB
LDWFAVLGLPRRYAVDLGAAEDNFRQLSRQFHPDRFAKADPRARRASLQRSVQLNEAWRTIKDPVRRAEYLLGLLGYDIGADEGASRPIGATGGKEPARPAAPVPADLLGEILELREELAEARARGDDPRVQQMAAEVRGRVHAALGRVAAAFARLEIMGKDDGAREREIGQAARDLGAIRYFRRFLDEVSVHDEDLAARDEGSPHA